MPNPTVKYLCEFFFTDFWHFVGLLLALSVLVSFRVVVARSGR